MTRNLILEDFSQPVTPDIQRPAASPVDPVSPNPPESPAAVDDDPKALDAFEQGYRNGWDDCIANETEERRRVGADLAVALSEISLSAEAMQKELLGSVAPVLESIAEQLLPKMAAEALAPVLLEEINAIVGSYGAVSLELLASPDKCASIEHMIQASTDLAVSVVPEPAFVEGQVSIRFAEQRRDIDLSNAVARMTEVLRAFTDGAHNSTGVAVAQPIETSLERGVA